LRAILTFRSQPFGHIDRTAGASYCAIAGTGIPLSLLPFRHFPFLLKIIQLQKLVAFLCVRGHLYSEYEAMTRGD
jgi:hypothetical protein